MVAAIDRAKTFERRRCGHLMDEDPLTERECMLSVVDPKGKGENKFRYVVVTQDEWLVCTCYCCCFFFVFFFFFPRLTFGGAIEGSVTISGGYAADVRAAKRHGRFP